MAEHVNLELIERLRDEVDWQVETERRNFLRRLYALIENGQCTLDEFRRVFRAREVKRLISDSAKDVLLYGGEDRAFVRFIEFVTQTGYTADNDHDQLNYMLKDVVRCKSDRFLKISRSLLFHIYARCNENYLDEETRPQHFHLACKYAIDELMKPLLELGQDPNCRWGVMGDTPLLLASRFVDAGSTIGLLLKNGADPNAANRRGSTPLHKLCLHADLDAIQTFFYYCDHEVQREVRLDARNARGWTPLHVALARNREEVAEILLRRGADPAAACSHDGTTPLHLVARHSCDPVLAATFFEICDEMRTVRFDAQDNLGNTPLHLITTKSDNLGNFENDLRRDADKRLLESLLRRGADPNLANKRGKTPLHVFCETDHSDELVRLLFEVCDERQLQVQVNARDKRGKTPLQLAVTNLLQNAVDVLLNHGADITNCNFPTSIDKEPQMIPNNPWRVLRVASGALAVAEHLEARGYQFSRRDAMTIVKYFAKVDLFEKSSDLEKCLLDDQEFSSAAKKSMLVPSLSLYDLIHLRPEEEEKLLTYTDYYVCAGQPASLMYIPYRHVNNCYLHMCEKLSRGFFRRWALDPFHELIRKRLPILCCENILEKLNNRDLYNICLAAEDQAS